MLEPLKCDSCGVGRALRTIRRVLLMVNGRVMNEHNLCTDCLGHVFDALQAKRAYG